MPHMTFDNSVARLECWRRIKLCQLVRKQGKKHAVGARKSRFARVKAAKAKAHMVKVRQALAERKAYDLWYWDESRFDERVRR